ncbi:MAG: flagellar motor switch protein FliN [Desulfatiglandales bacterium]
MNETNQSTDHVEEEASKGNESSPMDKYDLDLILDIHLDVSVELGRVKMLVNDLLKLGQGSIIELNKSVGEPLEIYINNKLIARGEVVVMDERFGIRVTDIISPLERVKSLG